MLTFHNDEKIKEKYVNRLLSHAKADEIIKGTYWEKGKGCAVGCTIHSNKHKNYETELGIPEWLARLEDCLFEGLSNEHAKTFAVDFLIAIPVGINLDSLKWKFCAFILKENIERVLSLKINDALKQQVIESIQGCLSIHENAIRTGHWDESAAESAASAARSAASAASAEWSAAWSMASAEWSAASAEWSAARSAASAEWSMASAEWSAAESAASAARSAAWSMAIAEWSAARSAAYKRYADELLRLLRETK